MKLIVSAKHFDLYQVEYDFVIYNDMAFRHEIESYDYVIKDKRGTIIAFVPCRSVRTNEKQELISFDIFSMRLADISNGIGEAVYEFMRAFLTQWHRNSHRDAEQNFKNNSKRFFSPL